MIDFEPVGDSPAIITQNLTKTYPVMRRRSGRFAGLRSFLAPIKETRTAVRDLTMTIHRGELVALLGPNGAGKSTTIKMLAGILTPNSGKVLVDGRVPYQDRRANARSVGAVFGQKTQLWWDLPARDSFSILRDIFDVPLLVYRRQLADFDSVLGLSSFWNTPVRNLSLGQRVRCEMAAAMLHDPSIVFLDEPTIGMDAVAKEQSREFLRAQVQDRGRTIVLTTHDMGEVARLCKRILLIKHGTLRFDGTLGALRKQFGGQPVVHVTFSSPVRVVDVPGATVVGRDQHRAVLSPGEGMTVEQLVRALTSKYPIVGLEVEESDIEDLVRDAYLANVDA